jgi:hypothetical protein
MITGAKYSDNKIMVHYVQDNNAIEAYNTKTNIKEVICGNCKAKINIARSIYESCGPESSCTAATAYYSEKKLLDVCEKIKVQPGDLCFIYMNNPLNYSYFMDKGIDARYVPGNRLIYLYYTMMRDLFGVKVTTLNKLTFDRFLDIVSSGFPIQFCFKEPGHYNTVIKVDKEKRIAYRVCPLPGLKVKDAEKKYIPFNKNGGWLEEMTEDDFTKNTWPIYNIYGDY